jgi:UTP:GlnB (protein PII) uridylyltransferase
MIVSMSEPATNNELSAFMASMPPSYLETFDRRAMAEHAQIVKERGSRPVHAAVWRVLPQGLAVVCVVARDRPGLLGTLSTAFVLHRLNVTTALVYCRQHEDGHAEAVDFFWVRRRDYRRGHREAPTPDDLDRCLRTLVGFVQADVEPEVLLTPSMAPPEPGPDPRVYFEESAQGEPHLVVEAPDGPGLLMAVARTLYRCQVTIVSSEVHTDGKRARDRFTIAAENSDTQSPAWREKLCNTLLEAISLWQRRSDLENGSSAKSGLG